MGIHRPYGVGAGYTEITVPEGNVGALLDANGQVYSAFFEGQTQSHPLQITGGQRIDLSILPADPVTGWNLLTGVATQTANGIEATLNAGNPDVIVDLPIFGVKNWHAVCTEISMTCANPGDGTRAGFSKDATNLFGVYLQALTGSWYSVASFDTFDTPISLAAVPSLAGVGFVADLNAPRVDAPTTYAHTVYAGALGTDIGQSSAARNGNATTPLALRLQARWSSGDDLSVIWPAISVVEHPLQFSMVN